MAKINVVQFLNSVFSKKCTEPESPQRYHRVGTRQQLAMEGMADGPKTVVNAEAPPGTNQTDFLKLNYGCLFLSARKPLLWMTINGT